MIVEYIAPNGDRLLIRPQTAVPYQGQRVRLQVWDGVVSFYRVQCVEWLLTLPAEPRQYYSLLDASEEIVRVLLKEELA